MDASHWNLSKLVVGLIMILVAVLLLLFGDNDSMKAGAVAFAVLGLASVATARRK